MSILAQTISKLNSTEAKHEHATIQLRWKGGVLQQAWIVMTFINGVCVGNTVEWRDIPSEE